MQYTEIRNYKTSMILEQDFSASFIPPLMPMFLNLFSCDNQRPRLHGNSFIYYVFFMYEKCAVTDKVRNSSTIPLTPIRVLAPRVCLDTLYVSVKLPSIISAQLFKGCCLAEQVMVIKSSASSLVE